MSERRNKLEIVNDILKAIQDKGGRIKPTHLLYKSNLSHKRMTKYVNELMERGLIVKTIEKNKNMYTLTEKGFNFLANYSKILEFTDAFGL